jgi:Protein of unknown function (DUF3138)
MKLWQPTALMLALAAAFPSVAFAQTNAELVEELKALKDRIGQLEEKLKATDAAAKSANEKQWGMTPAQVDDLNRVKVKTEALEDSMEAQGFKGLKISGQMDPSFIRNKVQNRTGFQFLNAVGDDGYNYDNSYFGAAMIDFQKEMEGGTKWRLTLAPNRGVGAVVDGQSIVHEASVSIPLGDLTTRLIAGQVPDWSGYEYLPATQNKLITHNLLFDFTLPTAYTGAGIELTRGKWITKAVLANMNAAKKSPGNKTPVVAYRVDYSRGEFQGFGFAGVHGKAVNFNECSTEECLGYKDSQVNLFEVDGYFIRGDWTVQGQLSFGQQKRASVTPGIDADGNTFLRDARWWGLSTLAAYKFSPRMEGIARFDYLNNKKNGGGLLGYTVPDGRNGIGPDLRLDETGSLIGDPNVGANRYALSLGLGYLYTQNVSFKAEYRLDRASQPVFFYNSDSSFRKNNSLFGLSTVVSF